MLPNQRTEPFAEQEPKASTQWPAGQQSGAPAPVPASIGSTQLGSVLVQVLVQRPQVDGDRRLLHTPEQHSPSVPQSAFPQHSAQAPVDAHRWKPLLHAQLKEPGELVQVALAPQRPGLAAHSSTSVHVRPLPVKPLRQVQDAPDTVSVHVAFGLQPPLFIWHSARAQTEPNSR